MNDIENQFTFNDIVFQVPPTDINITYQHGTEQSFALRSRYTNKVKTGAATVDINVRLVVLPQDLWKLHRLIVEFTLMPFWQCENNYLRTSFQMRTTEAIAVCARSLNIQTIPDLPDTLQVDLLLSQFNYKPFSNNFGFKKDYLFDVNGKSLTIDGTVIQDKDLFELVETPFNRLSPSDMRSKQTILEAINETAMLELDDLSPSPIKHKPTVSVNATDSNIYKYWINLEQAKRLEKTLGAFDLVSKISQSYGQDPSFSSANGLFKTPHVNFSWREYSPLGENSALRKILDALAPADSLGNTYNDAIDKALANQKGSLQANKEYKNVGTPLTATNGIGRITSRVGLRNNREHMGVDIGWGNTQYAGQSIGIYSTIKGTIYFTGHSSTAGNWTVVRGTGEHDGLWARYLHLAPARSQVGTQVEVGRFIGSAGTTANDIGESGQVHLHYELWEGGLPTAYGGPGGGHLVDPDNINPNTDGPAKLSVSKDIVQSLGADANKELKTAKKAELSPKDIEAAQYELFAKTAEGWRLYRSPHITPTLFRPHNLTVKSQSDESLDSELVAVGWGIELFNNFAFIPLVGQPYPTAQLVGGSDVRMNMQFIANTAGRLDGLSPKAQSMLNMIRTLDYNAKAARTIPDSYSVKINSIATTMLGEQSWSINAYNIQTLPNSPGASILNVQFDISKKFEPSIKQGGYDLNAVYKEIYEALKPYLSFTKKTDRSKTKTLTTEVSAGPRRQGLADGVDFLVERNGIRIPLFRHNDFTSPHTSPSEYFGIDILAIGSESAQRPNALISAIAGNRWDSRRDFFSGLPIGTVPEDDPYIIKVVQDLQDLLLLTSHSLSDKYFGGLSPEEVSSLDLWGWQDCVLPLFGDGVPQSDNPTIKDAYNSLTKNKQIHSDPALATKRGVLGLGLTLPGDLVDVTSTPGISLHQSNNTNTTPEIEREIVAELRNILSQFFHEVIINNDSAANHKIFIKVFDKLRLSTFANLQEAYPDLDLPSLPGVNDSKLTPVDFIFYNDSEDGSRDIVAGSVYANKTNAAVQNSFTSLEELARNKAAATQQVTGKVNYKSKHTQDLAPELKEWMQIEEEFLDAGTGRLPIKNFVKEGDESHQLDHSFDIDNVKLLSQEAVRDIVNTPRFLMRKVFPTFMLYFLDEQEGDNQWRSYSDFYNYSAIKTITLTRSRKIPADTLIIELQNVGGILDGTMIGALRDTDFAYRDWKGGKLSDRSSVAEALSASDKTGSAGEDQYFNSIVLREGMNVQLRLGYSNNPEQLEVEFNGRVMQVDWLDNHDSVSIMCQSWAVELIQIDKGITGKNLDGTTELDNPTLSYDIGYADTTELLSAMIRSPEVVHFGRWNVNSRFQYGEVSNPDDRDLSITRDIKPSKTQAYLSADINALFGDILDTEIPEKQTRLDSLFNENWFAGKEVGPIDVFEWNFLQRTREARNNPADDNIFAPDPFDLTQNNSSFDTVTKGTSRTTIGAIGGAAVGAIAGAIPGVGGFIPGSGVIPGGSTAGAVVGGAVGAVAAAKTDLQDLSGNIDPDDLVYYPVNSTIWEIFEEMTLRHPGWIASAVPYGRRMTMFFGVPSQRYWAKEITNGLAQRMRVLRESIAEMDKRESGSALPFDKNRFSSLITEYTKNLSSRFRPFRRYHLATSQHDIVQNNISVSNYGIFNAVTVLFNDTIFASLQRDEASEAEGKGKASRDTHEMKVHDGLAPEDTILESVDYFNCNGKPSAVRYGTGALMHSMKDMYKGSITLLGSPKIKPYDVIILADEYNGIAGPIEVEEVTHIISPATGFISIVVPDAMVIANETSSWTVLQAASTVGSLTKLSKLMDSTYEPTPFVTNGLTLPGQLSDAKSITKEVLASGNIVESLINLYNYWCRLNENIAVNIIPLRKHGKPMVAGIPEGLTDTLFTNYKNQAKRFYHDQTKGRFESEARSRLYGYQILYSFDDSLNNSKIKEIAEAHGVEKP